MGYHCSEAKSEPIGKQRIIHCFDLSDTTVRFKITALRPKGRKKARQSRGFVKEIVPETSVGISLQGQFRRNRQPKYEIVLNIIEPLAI